MHETLPLRRPRYRFLGLHQSVPTPSAGQDESVLRTAGCQRPCYKLLFPFLQRFGLKPPLRPTWRQVSRGIRTLHLHRLAGGRSISPREWNWPDHADERVATGVFCQQSCAVLWGCAAVLEPEDHRILRQDGFCAARERAASPDDPPHLDDPGPVWKTAVDFHSAPPIPLARTIPPS